MAARRSWGAILPSRLQSVSCDGVDRVRGQRSSVYTLPSDKAGSPHYSEVLRNPANSAEPNSGRIPTKAFAKGQRIGNARPPSERNEICLPWRGLKCEQRIVKGNERTSATSAKRRSRGEVCAWVNPERKLGKPDGQIGVRTGCIFDLRLVHSAKRAAVVPKLNNYVRPIPSHERTFCDEMVPLSLNRAVLASRQPARVQSRSERITWREIEEGQRHYQTYDNGIHNSVNQSSQYIDYHPIRIRTRGLPA